MTAPESHLHADAERSKVRVCLVTSAHTSGDARVFHKEALSLARAGYTVALACHESESHQRDGVQVLAVPAPRSRWSRMLTTSLRVAWRGLSWRARVFHLQDIELLPVGLLLKLLGKTVIFDVHEDFARDVRTKRYLPVATRRPLGAVIGFLQDWITRAFDAVVPATDSIAERFDPRHHRIVVVHNYPPMSWYGRTAKEAGPDDELTLVYAGVIHEDRGLTQLVQALARTRHRNVRLLLAGNPNPPGYIDELSRLPGFDRVEYLGFVPFERLPETLARADVGMSCLLPVGQFTVNFPTKLFDYLAHGLPVICSNFPLWERLMAEIGAGITADPADPDSIAAAIDYLAEHPHERLRMGERGYRVALERYSWQSQERQLVALYDALTLGSARRSTSADSAETPAPTPPA